MPQGGLCSDATRARYRQHCVRACDKVLRQLLTQLCLVRGTARGLYCSAMGFKTVRDSCCLRFVPPVIPVNIPLWWSFLLRLLR